MLIPIIYFYAKLSYLILFITYVFILYICVPLWTYVDFYL